MMVAMPERHVEEPRIVELAPRPTIALRVQGTANDIAQLFSDSMPRVFAKVEAAGATPASPVYGRYHEFSPDAVDVEIGVGVGETASGLKPLSDCEAGEVGASELPGGSAAALTHVGAYSTLSESYDRLHTWLHEQGREEGPGPWESYVDDPAVVTDHSLLRTEIVWPLA
jgi:effector-binding domain-containing protein